MNNVLKTQKISSTSTVKLDKNLLLFLVERLNVIRF